MIYTDKNDVHYSQEGVFCPFCEYELNDSIGVMEGDWYKCAVCGKGFVVLIHVETITAYGGKPLEDK